MKKPQDIDDDAEHDKDETAEEELLEQGKKRFKLARQALEKQREREKDDLRFQVPEHQWDEDARRQRQGFQIEGVPIPARPMLSVSKVDQPVQLVINQMRSAHLSVQIQPLSPESDPDTATVLEGIYRRIERDSNAHVARTWAFDRAVKCGRGYYRVSCEYDEASDQPDDQVVTIERILYQDAVFFDPAATKADFSDAEYAFAAAWVPAETFKRTYPDAETSPVTDQEWSDALEAEPEWVKADGDQKAFRVVEYWYKEHKKGKKGRDKVTVYRAVLSGFDVLDQDEWDGRYIPIIPVTGRELQPYDDERRYVGVIGPAKDAQRGYNYAISTAIERAALEPKAPFVGVEGQFEGHEAEWQQINVRSLPYVEYKAIGLEGGPAPPPARAEVSTQGLSVAMQLAAQFDQAIQVATATFDPSLGRTSQSEKSGRAIMALQQQSDSGNSHYLQNLSEVSMTYEAKVVLDLIAKKYDRAGRIARTLEEEGESKTIMLNQRFYHDPKSKQPIGLKDGQQPPRASMPPGPPMGPQGGPPMGPTQGGPPPGPPMQPPPMPPPQPEVKHYDLTKGQYSVAVVIGKERQTAMQEGSEMLGQILSSQPNLMPVIGPTWMKYQNWPGARELGELLKKMRDKQFPFLSGDDSDQPSAEQLQAQLQQQGQAMQAMQAQLQQAVQAIQLEQAKQQATLQKAQMDNQTRLQMEQMRQETQLLIKQIEEKLETQRTAVDQVHEAREAELDRDADMKKTMAGPVAQSMMTPPDLTFKAPNTVPLETE